MDTATILRQLWRLRLFVAFVVVLAIVAGLFVTVRLPSMETRKYSVGVATARILIDTPASQVVDVAPKGSDTLPIRASLLANLMVDGVVKSAIAKRAGLSPEKLFGIAQTAAGPSSVEPPKDPRAYVLSTEVLTTSSGDSLPIIQIEATAPDARAADKLANATVSGLRDYLDEKAVSQQVPDLQRVRVSSLGVTAARDVTRGPRFLYSIVVTVFLIVAGCAALLLISGVVRNLRNPPPERSPFDDDPFDPRLAWAARVHAETLADFEDRGRPEPAPMPRSAPATQTSRPAQSVGRSPEQRVKSAEGDAGNWWGGGPAD